MNQWNVVLCIYQNRSLCGRKLTVVNNSNIIFVTVYKKYERNETNLNGKDMGVPKQVK